jgi:hypothetical protein
MYDYLFLKDASSLRIIEPQFEAPPSIEEAFGTDEFDELPETDDYETDD